MILGECGMQNAECGMKIPNSLFDRFKNPQSATVRAVVPTAFRNPQSKGVTLIEVIIVMVIIGILAATVVPRIDFTISTTASVDGAAYIVASDIRYAQEWAMANRVSKTVTFATATPTVYTFSPSSSLDPSGQLPSGVTITTNYTVQFNSLGEPIAGGGGSVTVRAGASGPQRTISVTQYTGKVNIT
jgi:prepilin-type N-terminal cleavage/methylation domain-containing protein